VPPKVMQNVMWIKEIWLGEIYEAREIAKTKQVAQRIH
jgi:hypothetical protein